MQTDTGVYACLDTTKSVLSIMIYWWRKLYYLDEEEMNDIVFTADLIMGK